MAVQFAACFTFLGIPVFETSLRYGYSEVTKEYLGSDRGRYFAITVVSASAILLVNALLKLIPQRWISKMPQLDEQKSLGANSRLVSMYDRSARKTVNTSGKAPAQDIQDSYEAASQLNSNEDEGYERQL